MRIFNLPFNYGRLFKNKPLRILLITNALILTAGAMLGPIYALFVEEVGGDLLDASFSGAAFALAAALTTLVSGYYSDKIKRDEILVVAGYFTIGLGFLLFTMVSSIWSLLLVQVIIGFGEAVSAPAFDELYSGNLDKSEVGREWGAWEAMQYLSTGFGAIIGGLIATKLGFNPLFILMAALCFASAFYIFFLPKKFLHPS